MMVLLEYAALLAGFVYIRKKRLSLRSFFPVKRIDPVLLLLLPLLAYLLLIATSFVNAWSGLYFENAVEDTLKAAAEHFVWGTLVLCVIPAVTEELLFRGLLLHLFSDPGKGILGSAILFSLWHVNPNQMSYALLAGLLLAVMMVVTKNLSCCMVTHFLFNLYNLLTVAAGRDGPVGRVMGFLEAVRLHLIPPLAGPDRVLIVQHFIQGMIVASISAALFVLVLLIVEKRGKDREVAGP